MAWTVEVVMGSTILRSRIRLRTPYWLVGVGVHPYLYAFVQVRRRTPKTRLLLGSLPKRYARDRVPREGAAVDALTPWRSAVEMVRDDLLPPPYSGAIWEPKLDSQGECGQSVCRLLRSDQQEPKSVWPSR